MSKTTPKKPDRSQAEMLYDFSVIKLRREGYLPSDWVAGPMELAKLHRKVAEVCATPHPLDGKTDMYAAEMHWNLARYIEFVMNYNDEWPGEVIDQRQLAEDRKRWKRLQRLEDKS